LLTPFLLHSVGPWLAFGLPGALMIIATIMFWAGRNTFISIPGTGLISFFKDIRKKEVQKRIFYLLLINVFFSVFWSLFDQTGSTWVAQAKNDLVVKRIPLLDIPILPSQIQAINPLLVLLLVPLFSGVLYPFINKYYTLTYMRKITAGMFVGGFSFVVIAFIEYNITEGQPMSIMWQVLAYIILTSGEVMFYVTGLEFSYTQAPPSMKSIVMGIYMLSISLGNFIAAGVNFLIGRDSLGFSLDGGDYFMFFFFLMLATAILFQLIIARNYKERTYIFD
jgi:POT family proton-dependent oligopeptide transporter